MGGDSKKFLAAGAVGVTYYIYNKNKRGSEYTSDAESPSDTVYDIEDYYYYPVTHQNLDSTWHSEYRNIHKLKYSDETEKPNAISFFVRERHDSEEISFILGILKDDANEKFDNLEVQTIKSS
jgi:hypothetical protein